MSKLTSRRGAARFSRSVSLSALFLVMGAGAALAQAVVVQGNRRVDAETVRSYVAASGGGSPEQVRAALMNTGLFSNVRVSRRGSQTVVAVVENDSINRVAFEGNRRLKSEVLIGEVQSKARGPMSQDVINADAQRIREIYKRAGYGLSSVSGRIAPLPNGRSDVVFTVVESGKTGVLEINFSGNSTYSNYRLKGLMQTTESNFLSWIKTSDVYDPDKITLDLELVRRFYLKNGYADFQVLSTNTRFDEGRGGYIIDIAVSEGGQYRLNDVRVESSLRDVDASTLQRLATTSAGDTYNAEAVEKSLVAMTTEVTRRGYAFAQVRPRGERNAAGQTIGLVYVVEEGPRVYVERINVRGNNRTRDYVVRRELDMGEGDAYNKVFVDRAERRLNNLGYFAKVRITNEPGSAPDRVIVNVDVEDKATGSFSIAGGYSTSDGVIGEVSLSESNFLGRGQFVRIAATTGQRSKGVDFSFTEPYFMDRRMAAGFDLFSKFSDNTNSARYTSRTTGGQLRVTLPITEEFAITPRYSLYTTEIKIPNTISNPHNDCSNPIDGITPGTASFRNPFTGVVGGPADSSLNCLTNGEASVAVKEARGRTLTSLVGLTLAYNSLDNVQNPKNGFAAELKGDIAGLGGDSKFARLTGDARYYRELMDDVVGIFRVQGGHVSGFGGNLRLVDHFFLGPNLVRGFASSGLGPRDLNNDPRSNALGGSTYFGGSVEVQFPIPGLPREVGIKGAVFADAGTLFGYRGKTVFDLNGNGTIDGLTAAGCSYTATRQSECVTVRDRNVIRSSVGASLLWQSPLGPIRFDYAFALSKDKGVNGIGGDRLQAFRFSGGARF